MTPRELSTRIERWAVEVLRFSRPLLHHIETRDMALQLRRSATSAASNYGAATVARSHADFTSKLGIALEETDESWRWLRLLRDTSEATVLDTAFDALVEEGRQLTAILGAGHATAKRNRKS